MSLIDRLLKTSTIKDTAILAGSKFFAPKDMIVTNVPIINIALSANPFGGLTPGLTMFAGPSKHFKTMFALVLAKAYLDKYADAIILFYDSEFGSPQSYFSAMGIDTKRVIHTPIVDIEELKFDIMAQFAEIKRGDHVIVIIDSIGNLASKKEVEDALGGKSVADMSRAKQLKSLFRMVTPHLTLKDLPLVAINHTYKTLEIYAKDVVGGGTGSYYSAQNIYIIGRQQDKETSGADKGDLLGYNFVINVEKSRFVREKSKFIVNVRHGKGIDKWSGLLDIALESKNVVNSSKGKYQLIDEDGVVVGPEIKEKSLDGEFWKVVLASPRFTAFVKKTYSVSDGDILQSEDEEIPDDTDV
jgi:RecA/RadA recombinase